MKILFTLDDSEKFSYCFLCQTKEQGHHYYSTMIRVSAMYFEKFSNGNLAYSQDEYKIGNICHACADNVGKMNFMGVPDHIPKEQLQRFLKIFKRRGDKCEL